MKVEVLQNCKMKHKKSCPESNLLFIYDRNHLPRAAIRLDPSRLICTDHCNCKATMKAWPSGGNKSDKEPKQCIARNEHNLRYSIFDLISSIFNLNYKVKRNCVLPSQTHFYFLSRKIHWKLRRRHIV